MNTTELLFSQARPDDDLFSILLADVVILSLVKWFMSYGSNHNDRETGVELLVTIGSRRCGELFL